MAKKIAYINSSGNTGLVSSSSWKDSNNNDHSNAFNYELSNSEKEFYDDKYQKQKTPQTVSTVLKEETRSSSIFDRSFFSEMINNHRETEYNSDLKSMQISPKIEFSEYDLRKLHKTLNIYDTPYKSDTWQWDKSTEFYNRFKVQTVDDMLSRGFGHIIFIKPKCNILDTKSTLSSSSGLANNQMFVNALRNSPSLLNELCQLNRDTFMLSLSNKVTNFNVNEEFLADGTYGKTYTGHQVAYGKNNIESQTASQMTIDFQDDRSLHIYQLHKLWIEYISGCYRGTILPKASDIIDKILDYAGGVYYILTAEDGESIIYWEKYYGLFPTNISVDSLSWTRESPIFAPKFSVTYKYSFRKTFDPSIFIEFNHNANISSDLDYVPVFDKKLGHVGQSWVGVPYVESETTDGSNEVVYKLRFKKKQLPSFV